ncbi:hypothetical protein [Burkholderia sp. 8Y]|uniref:hypothetical protein n=1 Tax=Burkholderia sp. 8Y TaxID=2653133 RepID=UPI0013588BC7|nr:hypothetical protein [Burkholderia sp. 8Y]
MEPTQSKEAPRKRLSTRSLNVLSAMVGITTLALGVGWLIYSWTVDLEVPYFAIPLVLTVPVIAAVAFRNMWD